MYNKKNITFVMILLDFSEYKLQYASSFSKIWRVKRLEKTPTGRESCKEKTYG
jgi:hypothetical protein